MKNRDLRQALQLYAITNPSTLDTQKLKQDLMQAIAGGITSLQYRQKGLTADLRREQALELQQLCRQHGVLFFINDYVDLAMEIDADGVHLGADDMDPAQARQLLGADKIIGATAKTVERAIAAEQGGADYLGCGAVFGTTTKPDARPMTMERLRTITQAVSIPVVAIGGITADNALQLRDTGIAGLAVVGGIFGQKDIEAAAKRLRQDSIEVTGF